MLQNLNGNLLNSAFGSVEKMLSGKNFPQNSRALRMIEELLRDDISKMDNMAELKSFLEKIS